MNNIINQKSARPLYRFVDRQNRFTEVFDPRTGFYMRSGVIDDNGVETSEDPFMRCFPSLIDIGIMERCVCAKSCKVDCYQKAIDRTGPNMSLEDYRSIMEQAKGAVFQVALGGAGDPDTHDDFEEILRITREHRIVPNFTTSGIAFDENKARLCKKYCGAVAVSMHDAPYTYRAVKLLLDAGVKTNIHYVLGKNSIGDAIRRLKENDFPKGINAVVFLLYKPIGLGKAENVLDINDQDVAEFFRLVDKGNYDFKIGFDSCTCPGIVNKTSSVDLQSVDFCEGARFSCYIDANMNMMPCSFGNQDSKYYVSLRDHSIKDAWNSDVFNDFRWHLLCSCPKCNKRTACAGGCPICRDIVLCNNEEMEMAV